MQDISYSATNLADIAVCEQKHVLRHNKPRTTARVERGTKAHDAFLGSKQRDPAKQDPDALKEVIISFGRLLNILVSVFFSLPGLARILVLIIGAMMLAQHQVAIFALLIAAFVFWLWTDADRINKGVRLRKKAKHPVVLFAADKLDATPIYVEGRFYEEFRQFNHYGRPHGNVLLHGWLGQGCKLTGRPDMIVRTRSGLLVPVDCKTRTTGKVTLRDKVQLSAYRAIMACNRKIFDGCEIARHGYVVELSSGGKPADVIGTELLDTDDIEALFQKARIIDADPGRARINPTPNDEDGPGSSPCGHCLQRDNCETATLSIDAIGVDTGTA